MMHQLRFFFCLEMTKLLCLLNMVDWYARTISGKFYSGKVVLKKENTTIFHQVFPFFYFIKLFLINDPILGTYDSELFRIIYGPLVSALSFIYDQSEEVPMYKHVMNGFEKCALVAAHFGLSKNLDMLVLSLCKFTVFYSQRRQHNITVRTVI